MTRHRHTAASAAFKARAWPLLATLGMGAVGGIVAAAVWACTRQRSTRALAAAQRAGAAEASRMQDA